MDMCNGQVKDVFCARVVEIQALVNSDEVEHGKSGRDGWILRRCLVLMSDV